MKRLTALLMGCLMLTGAFASCGDSSDSDTSAKEKASSTSEVSTEESSEASTAEKTTKAAATTREKATKAAQSLEDSDFLGKWQSFKVVDNGTVYEDVYALVNVDEICLMELTDDGKGKVNISGVDSEIEWSLNSKGNADVPDLNGEAVELVLEGGNMSITDEDGVVVYLKSVGKFKKTDTEKPSDEGIDDQSVVGEWLTQENGFDGSYIYKADGKGSVTLDSSSIINCANGDLNMNGTSLGSTFHTLKDGVFTLNISGVDYLTMKKADSSPKDSIDGLYDVTSGQFFDQFKDTYNNTPTYSLQFVFSDNGSKTEFVLNDCFTYSVKDGKLTIIDGADLFANSSIDYEVKGDKMTFTVGMAKQEFTRK
jgi:hypothetical protein